jgi:predicted DNA-binding transcriptional regulator AlpA
VTVEVIVQVPRSALTRAEAAASLGVSSKTFDRYVKDHLKVVYAGTMRLYPVSEIERWLNRSAQLAPANRTQA